MCQQTNRKRITISDCDFQEQDCSRPRKVQKITSALPDRMLAQPSNVEKPIQFLMKALEMQQVKTQIHSYSSLEDFFLEPTQEEIDSYGFGVLNEVQFRDIDLLQSLHKEGQPIKCSNQFGESLLHLACRKGLIDVVDFFINELEVPLQVRDDMGRSPLHDACWMAEPNFELVSLLVSKCPDLLYISDKRGHTPLCYIRREHWSDWNVYLQKEIDLLSPEILKP